MQHISIATRTTDPELVRIHQALANPILVDGRADLEVVLGGLLRAPATERTLDLIGHSTPNKSLLILGDWVIDAGSSTVTAFFRELAEQQVLARLGVTALRLLGCNTAQTGQGKATLRVLSEILGLPVYGTTEPIFVTHYAADGFRADFAHHLVEAAQVGHHEPTPTRKQINAGTVQLLDIDALPASSSTAPSGEWTHRMATEKQLGEILRHVRRNEGAEMPGLLSQPVCELIFPIATALYGRMQIVLDGQFVRVYPRTRGPGFVYPVSDVRAVLGAIAELPLAQRAQRNPSPYSRNT
jgi:hypothetical protein